MKQILGYILVAASILIMFPLGAIPLETFSSYMTDHRDEGSKGQWVQYMAKGTTDDQMYVLEVDPTTGEIPVSATVTFPYDTDFGAVGADTLRSAAQIGNATGAASFGSGASGAQTLRVITSTDSEIKITDGTDDLAVNADGSLNVTASATDLDIRDLTDASDSVSIGDGTDTLGVNADGSIEVNQTALTPGTDEVAIGDGTDTLAVNADGSINTVATATDLDVRDLVHTADTIRLGDGVDLTLVSAAGELQVRDDDANTDLDTIAGAVSGTEMQVDVVASLPAGTNNIGDVDVNNLPATVDTNSGAAGASTVRTVLATRHEAAATPVAVRLSDGSNFAAPATAGRSYSDSVRNDYSSTNVTTGAWVELIASTAGDINALFIFDSCGQTLELGTGAAASETRVLIIPPGGIDGPVPLNIPSGTRVAIKAISADCTSGEINITGLN